MVRHAAVELLSELRKANDLAGLFALKPRPGDYEAVFVPQSVEAARHGFETTLWSSPRRGALAEGAQVQLRCAIAWSHDVGKNSSFPGGYKKAVDHLIPYVPWVVWKFTKPGEVVGRSFNGLVYVNDHWAWFPKPWRALAVRQLEN